MAEIIKPRQTEMVITGDLSVIMHNYLIFREAFFDDFTEEDYYARQELEDVVVGVKGVPQEVSRAYLRVKRKQGVTFIRAKDLGVPDQPWNKLYGTMGDLDIVTAELMRRRTLAVENFVSDLE